MTMLNKTTLPNGIRVTEEGRILYFWRRWNGLALVVGSLLGFFLFLSDPNLLSDILSPPFRFFELVPIATLLVVFAFAYWGLGWVVNRTELFVKQDLLLVRIRPLPWIGNVTIPTSEIAEIKVEEKWEREAYTDTTIRVYSLIASKNSGTTKKLISRIRKLDQAAVIRQELQRLLGISSTQFSTTTVDQPVILKVEQLPPRLRIKIEEFPPELQPKVRNLYEAFHPDPEQVIHFLMILDEAEGNIEEVERLAKAAQDSNFDKKLFWNLFKHS
jgi:hypothetical protein